MAAASTSLLFVVLASRFAETIQVSTITSLSAPGLSSTRSRLETAPLVNASIRTKPASGPVLGERLQLSCGPLLRALLLKVGNRTANKTCAWRIAWLSNGTVLKRVVQGGSMKQRGRCGQVLRFMHVQPEHSGIYKCIVTAHGKSWSSKDYHLLIKAPEITDLSLFFNVPYGVNVTWSYPTHLAEISVRYVVVLFMTIRLPAYAVQVCNTTRLWCQINKLSQYSPVLIQVTPLLGKSMGKAIESNWLRPGWDTPLGSPSEVSAEPWTDCTLRVNWSLAIEYQSLILREKIMVAIQYGQSGLAKMSNVSIRIADNHPYSYVLTGLLCNTSYKLGLSVWTNNQQTSGVGRILTVKTALKVPPRVEIVNAIASVDGVNLQWKVRWPFSGNTSTSGFSICTTALQELLACGNDTSSQARDHYPRTTCMKIYGPSHRNYTMKFLQAITNYSIRIDAFNSFGHSSGIPGKITTLPSAPTWCSDLNMSRIAHCQRVDSTTLHLTWKAPTWNGQPVKYVATLRPVGSGVSVSYNIHTNRTSWTPTGLAEGQVYIVQLAAVNAIGRSTLLLPRCSVARFTESPSEKKTSLRPTSAVSPKALLTKSLTMASEKRIPEQKKLTDEGKDITASTTVADLSPTTLMILGVSMGMLLLVVTVSVAIHLRCRRSPGFHDLPELDRRSQERKSLQQRFESNDYGPLPAQSRSPTPEQPTQATVVRWSSQGSLNSQTTCLTDISEPSIYLDLAEQN